MSESAKASAARSGRGPRIDVMRSQLGRVRGLGAAGHGTGTWWLERVTSVALVPLCLWFVFAVFHLIGMPRIDVAHWAANPINASLLLALLITVFYHMQLGLQVVVEDYIHSESARLPLLLAIKGVTVLIALACVVSVLKLAFTG